MSVEVEGLLREGMQDGAAGLRSLIAKRTFISFA